jgi:hypothetical protein
LHLKVDARLLQPDSTPMAVLIGGEGNAAVDDTLVEAEIFSRLVSAYDAQYLNLSWSRGCHENTHDRIDGNVAELILDAAAYSAVVLVDVHRRF